MLWSFPALKDKPGLGPHALMRPGLTLAWALQSSAQQPLRHPAGTAQSLAPGRADLGEDHSRGIWAFLLCTRVKWGFLLRRAGLGEDHARWFFQQVVLALDYCHKMSISNRDIKLENTLLDNVEPGRRPLIKLCDFGYSINESHSLPKTAVGTPGYTGAPLQ